MSSPLDRRCSAVRSAVSVTTGFVLVFVILGVVLSSLADRIRGQLPWVTMLIGGVLIVAGVAVMAGRQLPMPAFTLRAASGRGAVGMVSYGVVYALASLSCTIGPFLAITSAALDQSLAGGLLAYVAYGLGMGTIILAIAASAALARPKPGMPSSLIKNRTPGGALMITVARTHLVRTELVQRRPVDRRDHRHGERWRLWRSPSSRTWVRIQGDAADRRGATIGINQIVRASVATGTTTRSSTVGSAACARWG
jgi:cytochrome c biogenesis protein CcdA